MRRTLILPLLLFVKYYSPRREHIDKKTGGCQKFSKFQKIKEFLASWKRKKKRTTRVIVADCSLRFLVCDRLLNQHHTHTKHTQNTQILRKETRETEDRTNEQKWTTRECSVSGCMDLCLSLLFETFIPFFSYAVSVSCFVYSSS